MSDLKTNSDGLSTPILAKLAIENKILTEVQLKQALSGLRIEKLKGNTLTLCDYLVEQSLVDKETMARLMAATVRHLDKQFGALAVEHGYVPADIVSRALDIQKNDFKSGKLTLITDILIESKHLTEEQRDILLAKMTEHDTPKGYDSEKDKSRENRAAQPKQAEPVEYQPPLSIVISDQNLRADIHVAGGLETAPGVRDIRQLVEAHGIGFGILNNQDIERHLAKTGQNAYHFVVALGIAAVPPRDASIRLHFNNNYLNPGRVTEEGVIDFRDRGTVPFVKAGDCLAEKVPMVDGKPGRDIFGQEIPVDKPVDQGFKKGTGTELSEDTLKIIATVDGQPIMTVHGEFMVMKEMVVSGDVDYTTGNIFFDGSVIVKGTVNKGFTVKSGALTAHSILGATVDVKGNIDVSGGIIDSVLNSGGTIQSMYMTGTKADSFGDVLVKKEIIDCRIKTSGLCSGDKVSIISSYVAAKQGIEVMRIGTDVSKASIVKAGVDEHIDRKIRKLRESLEEKKAMLDKDQKRVENSIEEQKMVHKKIEDQTKVEERLVVQKNAIEDRLSRIGDDTTLNDSEKKQVRLLKEGLKYIMAETAKLNEVVAECFVKQDELTNDILNYQSLCETIVFDIEDLNTKIRELKVWDKKSHPSPHVTATKEIYSLTSISGINANMIVHDTLHNVTVREVRDSETNTWEMVIESN
jgi:uncharacterized protein (DUF342 family)